MCSAEQQRIAELERLVEAKGRSPNTAGRTQTQCTPTAERLSVIVQGYLRRVIGVVQ